MTSSRLRSLLAPLGVFVAVAGVFLGLWHFSERQERDAVEMRTRLAAEEVAFRLEDYVGARLGLLRSVRDDWVQGRIGNREEFTGRAETLQRYFAGIVAVNWVDAEGTIRWVVPQSRNEAARGRDLTRHPVAGPVLRAAIADGELRITPPLELYQSGHGFAAYVPVVRDGELLGVVNAAFRFAPLIDDCLARGVREHFFFKLRDGDAPIHEFGIRSNDDSPFEARGEIRLGGRTWTVALQPNAELVATAESPADEILGLLGVALALGLALATARLSRRGAELRESRESYRSLVEDMPALVCRFKPDTTLTFVNQAYADYFGRTPEQLVGTRFLDLVPEEGRSVVLDTLAALTPESPTNAYEHQVIGPDGERRWQEWRDRALFDANGAVYEFQSVGVDTTDSRRIEESLRESEERSRTIFESVSEGILLCDRDGQVVDVNERACELFGLTREQLLAVDLDRLSADVSQPETPWYEHLRDADGARLYQWEARHDSGSAWCAEVNLRETTIGGQERMLAVIRDVTERRLLENRLRQAQKMEAVGTLAGGIAHDFNNILTAILGHAELARARAGHDTALDGALRGIGQACEQASGLTRSLLTFSREAEVAKAPVDLARLVSETIGMLGPMLPDAIELVRDDAVEGPLWVEADRTQLQQVLMNLAVNSRDAMPDGGAIRISLRARPGLACLTVADTGTGMPESVRHRVIEPFFTTKPRERGTGLGMAVVHGIVSDHGGTMDIHSREGEGTEVSVCLPRCAAPAETAGERAPAAVPRGGGARILVVEDNEAVRRLIADVMRAHGFDVIEAGDGAAAVRLYLDHADSLRLLILDVDLPRMSGTDCLSEIRKTGSGAPAILISGNPEFAFAGDDDRGEVEFLAKPFAVSQLTDLAGRMIG